MSGARRSDARALLLGLVGSGIERSLTPAMQEREGGEHGIDLTYHRIDAEQRGFGVDDLPDVLTWAERLGFRGLNVTHPFKQAVVPLLDELSDEARHLGAVNTVVFHDGRRLGFNTDAPGFARAFRAALPEAVGDRVVLVGAGGAGVSVGYGLLAQGAARVEVHDADADRASACVVRLSERYGEQRVGVVHDLPAALEQAQGLVNATPVGMHGHPGLPVADDLVRPELWVSDVVYFPLQTELVRLARSRGCRVLTGGGMAVQQAVVAFEHFTGEPADAERMARHFAELSA